MERHTFKLCENTILSTRECCYLGVNFTLCGSLKIAQNKLRQKGLRRYFSLKIMKSLQHIRKNLLFKLFDTLFQPIVTYACPVWLPNTGLFKLFGQDNKTKNATKIIALDPLRKLHISHSSNGLWVSTNIHQTQLFGRLWALPTIQAVLGIETWAIIKFPPYHRGCFQEKMLF